MAKGRPQREPMERLVRIASALSAHPKRGLHVDKLLDVAGYPHTESGREQLKRELRHLERQGWQIETAIDDDDQKATYRMVTLDNRLKVRLTPAQATALERAALVVKRADLLDRLGLPTGEKLAEEPADVRLGSDPALDEILLAIRHGARLRFRYNGSDRLTHPQSVRQQNGKWYVGAIEESGDKVKNFLVTRMSAVESDVPGTAHLEIRDRHAGLHPMRWEVDPPVDVMLRVDAGFRADVVRWLLEPASETARDGTIEMRYQVTNRSAFRDRLYELGSRVELLGPPQVRDEVLAELVQCSEGSTR